MDIPRPSKPLSGSSTPPAASPEPQRLFLREPGWRVVLKAGSEREFCYQMAPGQDFYHRLLDGEIYLQHGDERLCLACAARRGLLHLEARPLRQPLHPIDLPSETGGTFDSDSEFEIDLPFDPPGAGEGPPAR
jgi:hypothetical protein